MQKGRHGDLGMREVLCHWDEGGHVTRTCEQALGTENSHWSTAGPRGPQSNRHEGVNSTNSWKEIGSRLLPWAFSQQPSLSDTSISTLSDPKLKIKNKNKKSKTKKRKSSRTYQNYFWPQNCEIIKQYCLMLLSLIIFSTAIENKYTFWTTSLESDAQKFTFNKLPILLHAE